MQRGQQVSGGGEVQTFGQRLISFATDLEQRFSRDGDKSAFIDPTLQAHSLHEGVWSFFGIQEGSTAFTNVEQVPTILEQSERGRTHLQDVLERLKTSNSQLAQLLDAKVGKILIDVGAVQKMHEALMAAPLDSEEHRDPSNDSSGGWWKSFTGTLASLGSKVLGDGTE